MTWLWAVFTFLNLWWICAFIVIAIQQQSTKNLKATFYFTSMFSALVTGTIAVLMRYGIIRFY